MSEPISDEELAQYRNDLGHDAQAWYWDAVNVGGLIARLDAAESKLAAAERAAYDLAEDRANWRAQAQRAEAVIEAAREWTRRRAQYAESLTSRNSDPALLAALHLGCAKAESVIIDALAAYDRALSTTPRGAGMNDEALLDAVVDSLPDAVTTWKIGGNWREAAAVFVRRLTGQGFNVVPIRFSAPRSTTPEEPKP